MTSLTEQQNSGIVFVKSPFVRGKASCPCQRIFVVYFPITNILVDMRLKSLLATRQSNITDHSSKLAKDQANLLYSRYYLVC